VLSTEESVCLMDLGCVLYRHEQHEIPIKMREVDNIINEIESGCKIRYKPRNQLEEEESHTSPLDSD